MMAAAVAQAAKPEQSGGVQGVSVTEEGYSAFEVREVRQFQGWFLNFEFESVAVPHKHRICCINNCLYI